jgi:DNA-binding IclR family transcriptional regulator
MEKKIIEILQVLDRTSACCPLGYISMHTNIAMPLKIMEALAEEGYVRRHQKDSDWSPQGPLFEITTKARQELRKLEANVLQVPLTLVAQKIANR